MAVTQDIEPQPTPRGLLTSSALSLAHCAACCHYHQNRKRSVIYPRLLQQPSISIMELTPGPAGGNSYTAFYMGGPFPRKPVMESEFEGKRHRFPTTFLLSNILPKHPENYYPQLYHLQTES